MVKRFPRLCVFLCFCISIIIFCSGRNIFSLELKPHAEKLLKEKRFTELFDFLDTVKKESKESDEPQIEYYSVLSKSMYLDSLEEEEDWENFYNNVNKFNAEIIKTANNAARKYPVSVEIVQMQYLSWKACIREDDQEAADEAYNELINTVIKYTEESNDISVFKNIAEKISDEGKVRQLNELFSSYKDYLSRNNAGISSIETLGKLAEEYLKEGKVDTAKVIYKHYISLVLKNYPKEKARSVLIEICEKFRSHGYYKAKDAGFAEEVYLYLTENIEQGVLKEENLFARAYNLEMMGNYRRAQRQYENFIGAYPQSKFIAEVYTRLGIISLFVFARPEEAQRFFKKVIEDFPNSFFSPFCMYHGALIYQLNGRKQNASPLYAKLIEDKGMFSKAARQRLDEIKNKTRMDENIKKRFDSIFNKDEKSSIMLTLKSEPERAFVNEPVIWDATAQDFSSGSIQPVFTYKWGGDTGSNDEPGNVTQFSTSYGEASPYIVSFIAKTGDFENIISRCLWVHELIVNLLPGDNTCKAGTLVELSAAISPVSIEDVKAGFKWKIPSLGITQEGKNFQYTFDKRGSYDVELEADIGGITVKKFKIEVVD